MKRLFVLFIVFNLSLLSVYSQDAFIYSPKGKTNLKYSYKKVLITHSKSTSKAQVEKNERYKAVKELSDTILNFTDTPNPFSIAVIGKNKLNRSTLLDFLSKGNDTIISVYPFMETEDGNELGISNRINIKLKEGTKIESFTTLFKEIKVTKIVDNQYIKNFYQLTVSSKEPINVVNHLTEAGYFEFAEIDALIVGKKHTNDAFFNQQWAVQRMDIEDTWNLSTGSGIKIAIIDDGVDISHPDLINNLYNNGFDATGNRSDASPRSYDAHGTNCAGIACATANNGI